MARNSTVTAVDPAIVHFARRLADDIAAERVLLTGPISDDADDLDGDLEVIIVSERFAGIDRFEREYGLKALFYELGGNSPMHLHCLTPEEFAQGKSRLSLLAAVLPDAIDLLAA